MKETTTLGSLPVDQIARDGSLRSAPDVKLSDREKNTLLLTALPGATVQTYAGERVVRFGEQMILKKQVTHLGIPWESFKKRIQIPKRWLEVHRQALADRLTPRFVGIYHFSGVTIFVDFDPSTYVGRKANNSAAHVSTNDLFQAQTLGVFTRTDRNGNRLTSVRADKFAGYLLGAVSTLHPRVEVFSRFSEQFLHAPRLDWTDGVGQMYRAGWPDRFQGEWPGFYLEYRLDGFLRQHQIEDVVGFQKVKTKGHYDFDLVFPAGQDVAYYGDLKASNRSTTESLGNDAEDLTRCLREFGRFWYVIYEHETWHGRTEGDAPTIAWNEWKRSVGYDNGKPYDPLSYRTRFKSAVRYTSMKILEVNDANKHIVLGDFNQGAQQGGASRKPKVTIKKKDIDNFLIFTDGLTVQSTQETRSR